MLRESLVADKRALRDALAYFGISRDDVRRRFEVNESSRSTSTATPFLFQHTSRNVSSQSWREMYGLRSPQSILCAIEPSLCLPHQHSNTSAIPGNRSMPGTFMPVP